MGDHVKVGAGPGKFKIRIVDGTGGVAEGNHLRLDRVGERFSP
jgi:hypothetical protein